MILGIDQGAWLTRKRIIALGAILLAFQVLVLAFLVAGSFGIVKRYGPDAVSFVAFYAAGQLTAEGQPKLVYSEVIQHEAEEALTHPGVRYIPFLYPPVYLLVCSPLTVLPIFFSFIAFDIITLLMFLSVVRRILGETGYGWLLPALAFPPTIWTLGYGQNSFLTAALIGAGTLLIDRRPFLAGLLFGMLCYKPHFALLIPVAFIAGRRWPAFFGAAISVSIIVGVSLLVLGLDTWQAYFRSFFGSAATYDLAVEHANIFASISPVAAARLFGVSAVDARYVQAAATLSAVFLVGWVWRINATLATRAAVLAASALIAAPYGLLYDLVIAAIAGAWLVRAGRETGFFTWEKSTLAMVYLLPLFAFQTALLSRLPIVPLPGALLVLVCAYRAWQEHQHRKAAKINTAPQGMC
jgi:alpha-1,2-mannosyltransferase